MRGAWFLFVMGLGPGLLAPPARAQGASTSERSVARELGYSGIEAFQAGQYAVASERLEKAYAVMRVPSLGLWAARALAKQGKLLEAADRYAEVTRLEISKGDEEVQRKAQAEAQAELDQTRQVLPTITIVFDGASPADMSLRVDGVEVSPQLVGEATPLNPGKHRVEVHAGGKVRSRTFTLGSSEKRQVKFKAGEPPGNTEESSPEPAVAPAPGNAAPAADEAPLSRRKLGWITAGVGAAGLVVGGITGAVVLSKRDSLDKTCKDGHCSRDQSADVDSYNGMRNVSTAAFVVGGVLVATGVVLVLSQPAAQRPRATLRLSPAFASLEYHFQ